MHVLLLLLVVFVVIVIISRSRQQVRRCQWQEDPSSHRGTLRKYRCGACGAEAYTSTDGPPETCRNPNRSA